MVCPYSYITPVHRGVIGEQQVEVELLPGNLHSRLFHGNCSHLNVFPVGAVFISEIIRHKNAITIHLPRSAF